jgi:hypothetical protein
MRELMRPTSLRRLCLRSSLSIDEICYFISIALICTEVERKQDKAGPWAKHFLRVISYCYFTTQAFIFIKLFNILFGPARKFEDKTVNFSIS